MLARSGDVNKLQILENRVLRIILNYPKYVIRRYLHRDSNKEPINERIRSLAVTFHNDVITHPNPSISMQPFSIATGRHNTQFNQLLSRASFDDNPLLADFRKHHPKQELLSTRIQDELLPSHPIAPARKEKPFLRSKDALMSRGREMAASVPPLACCNEKRKPLVSLKEADFCGMCFSYPTSEGELLAKGAYVPTPGRSIAPIKYRGVSLDFPALKNAIDRCAVTLRWFRTNERKLSGQSKESALAFGSEEDAK
ncbi:hypothetical protein TNCV_738891 [Trichonephila clavipes]|nr:hypothetical protein TNCV_738891 [Trichonephila clavipes]